MSKPNDDDVDPALEAELERTVRGLKHLGAPAALRSALDERVRAGLGRRDRPAWWRRGLTVPAPLVAATAFLWVVLAAAYVAREIAPRATFQASGPSADGAGSIAAGPLVRTETVYALGYGEVLTRQEVDLRRERN